MSDEGRDFVKRRSPFKGSTFWLHYVLGDLANKQHGYEIWVTDKTLAEEWPLGVRSIERGRAELVEAGFLKVLDAATGPGRPLRYRFVFKGEDNGRQSGGRTEAEHTRQSGGRPETNTRQPDENTRQSGGEHPPKARPVPLTNQRELKGTELARPRDFGSAVVDDADKLLALAMQQPVKPPLRRKALAIIVSALRNGHTYATLDRTIRAGVGVWTYDGFCTAVAKSVPRPNPLSRGGPSLIELYAAVEAEDNAKSACEPPPPRLQLGTL